MDRFVDVLFRHSRAILVCWVLFSLVGGWFALGLEGRVVPGGEASSSSQAESVARTLSANGAPSLFVVVTGDAAERNGASQNESRDLAGLRAALADKPGVREVAPLPLPPAAAGAGPITVLGVSTTGGIDGSIDVAHAILDDHGLAPAGSHTYVGGYGAHREELVELSRTDLLRAEQFGLPVVLIVLLLTFGSVRATLVPFTIGLTALLGGLGAAGALAFVVPFSEFVTNAATMVGLALAIDYAMFLVQRVREALLRGETVDDAVREAMRTTGVAIAWSGVTVMLAEATMLLVDARVVRTAALGMILVTAAAIVAALVGAPIVLRWLGHRILRRAERRRPGLSVPATISPTTATSTATSPPAATSTGAAPSADGEPRRPVTRAVGVVRMAAIAREAMGFWHRWGRWVAARPVRSLASAAVVLAALCVPVLGLGHHVDIPSASALPADSQVRQATELAATAYGPGVISPVEIVVHSAAGQARDEASWVEAALRSDPEVRAMTATPLARPGDYRITVATADGPADDGAQDLVRSLRDGDLRRSLGGIRYDVGGESAARIDATHALFASLPLTLTVLLGLVLVLLVVAMRSIVLPLKAIVLVIGSLGASIGGLLLLSTTDLGARLIGWSSPEDLHPIVPVTIVAITIALSTDYEVILISRIAERYRVTRDNTTAIVDGVARTGRVISSAAAIMIAVFLGFALSQVTPLKQLGVGLALAVLIDATVVRGVLVPASMRLMGRWNWWLPRLPVRRAGTTAPTSPPVVAVRPVGRVRLDRGTGAPAHPGSPDGLVRSASGPGDRS